MSSNQRCSSPLLDYHCDCHVHTKWCGHAIGSMEEYVLAAITKDLHKIVFLEHMEDGIGYPEKTWLSDSEFDRYFEEGERLKTIYSSDIEIGLGVECGYNPDEKDSLVKRLNARQWDTIGISCHFLKIANQPFHLNLLTRKPSVIEQCSRIGAKRIIPQYLETLMEAVETLPGTTLCHLDAALRHMPGVDIATDYPVLVEKLLQLVKKEKMSLEINTSGFSIRQQQFPADSILNRAIELEIPLTLGSDAHQPEDVGRSFNDFSPEKN